MSPKNNESDENSISSDDDNEPQAKPNNVLALKNKMVKGSVPNRRTKSYKFPKEIIIEKLSSFSEKSEDSNEEISEMAKYLQTMQTNHDDNLMYFSGCFKEASNGSSEVMLHTNPNEDQFHSDIQLR